MNMSPRESVVEKNNKIMTSIRETTQQIAESMTENDGDVQNLLASGKSFLQYERERLQTCYVTTDQAERQADDLQTKLASAQIGIKNLRHWPKIAPEEIRKNTIDSSGNIQETSIQVYGRKIPLKDIMLKEIQRLTKSGILISRSDEHYQSLSKEAVYNRLKQISSSTKSTETDSTLASEINRLMTLERQINLKIWHDHSDILNHTYISFMVSFIYDHANFLTNEEFRETYPKKKPVDVQAVVERPNLYIFWTIRTEDLQELRKGIVFDGIPYTFQLRFFSGDGPARQFEAGQQRGGNFSCLCGVHSKEHMNLECCFKRTPSDLEDRRAVFLKGESLVKIKQGNINPFQNLTKDELIEELECRGFDTFRLKTKARLQEEMSDLLHGISRPPALLLHYPEKSLTESNISCYEVLPCEPLHDISNVVQNIIQELPHHVKQNSTKLELEKFCNNTIGDKNQIKGSDARLYAIKLSKFIENLQLDGKIFVRYFTTY
ncbi:unnamed protein product [Mytilus coruscus]|uniref:Uncharacterized protein n=1 Tax=Mytilus coruscus TaxID=42192 RepID=A0A6J8C156_MYTCO|nr:unnamed protein product [Mytilus coruscus]